MNATKRKAAGGYHTTTTAIKKTHMYEALGCKNHQASLKRCATFQPTPAMLGPVLENTWVIAGSLPDSEAFSRLRNFGFGRDGLVREAGRMAIPMFSTSRPPASLEKAASGFESRIGAKTMTNVISMARARVAASPQTSAQTLDLINHQAAIENSLSLALYYVRGDRHNGLHLATAKANRALSLLKQACAAEASTVREV